MTESMKEFLDYNSDTGIFTWKIKPSMSTEAGATAGTKCKKTNYVKISFKDKLYKAHQMAWFFVYGKKPIGIIDHINGIRNDNRIANLREVTTRENCSNRIQHRNGKLVGCYFRKDTRKWAAEITINNKKKALGCFFTEQEAHQEYLKARKELVGY